MAIKKNKLSYLEYLNNINVNMYTYNMKYDRRIVAHFCTDIVIYEKVE